jgi:hypothetical protein
VLAHQPAQRRVALDPGHEVVLVSGDHDASLGCITS